MFLKIKKTRKILHRTILYCLISLLGISYIELAAAGGGYSDYSDLLIDSLIEYLIKHKVCDSERSCAKMIQTRTEGSKTIYINMYGQTDTEVTSHAVAFFIEDALKISKDTPVTLSIYPKPHGDYINKDFFSKKNHLVQLLINKEKK